MENFDLNNESNNIDGIEKLVINLELLRYAHWEVTTIDGTSAENTT